MLLVSLYNGQMQVLGKLLDVAQKFCENLLL